MFPRMFSSMFSSMSRNECHNKFPGMFRGTRIPQIALALGAVILVVLCVMPPVSFQLTDLGIGYGAVSLNLVGEAPHAAATAAMFHIGGCKSVGHADICAHKELSFDRAHGLRFAATVTTQRPNGV